MRKKVIAGNWKMNMNQKNTKEFIRKLASNLDPQNDANIILCVPFVHLAYAIEAIRETKIKIGAQNMHWKEKGAYTGEISPNMLKEMGVEYVIIGHSERRKYFAETDESVNKKIKSALENELIPIVCVGETLEQKERMETEEVITNQVGLALEGLTNEEVKRVIIAYEPIWAIGTGKTATSEDANSSIIAIRRKIANNYKKSIADNVIILYGGSMNSKNANELLKTSDIDGGLIGGASLKIDEFTKIINFCKNK